MKNRIHTPSKVEAQVMYKSHLQCCVCKEKGHHIHHLDSNPSNSSFDNLVLLCFTHHDEATKGKSLSRKLSKETLILYREEHYKNIENERNRSIEIINKPIDKLTSEDLLTASLNAIIILEITKLDRDVSPNDWKKTSDVIEKLHLYSDHNNPRIALEIFQLLRSVAAFTRHKMPSDVSSAIYGACVTFMPYLGDEETKEESIEIAKHVIDIGDNIIYDAFKYLNDLSVAFWGMLIIKYVYRSAKRLKIDELQTLVKDTFANIKVNVSKPHRWDQSNAKILVESFVNELEEWDLSYPKLPTDVMELVYPQ